jgi:transaldolase
MCVVRASSRCIEQKGVKLNVTVIFTLEQVRIAVGSLFIDVSSYISIFAGRIADTGVASAHSQRSPEPDPPGAFSDWIVCR